MLTQERLKEVLHYNPDTGIFTWIARAAYNTHVGSQAGNHCKVSGYIRIGIDGRSYRASRLAVLYMTGRWPRRIVDHKDRNRANNRWLNLREASYSQNNSNITARTKSGSSVPGVYWYADREKWRAIITVNRKMVSLGYYPELELAELVASEARNKVYGEAGS